MINRLIKYVIPFIVVLSFFACTQNIPYRIEGKLNDK